MLGSIVYYQYKESSKKVVDKIYGNFCSNF